MERREGGGKRAGEEEGRNYLMFMVHRIEIKLFTLS